MPVTGVVSMASKRSIVEMLARTIEFSSTFSKHLEWLGRKRLLKQDALLLGPPPSQFSRLLAMEFARRNRLEVEVVSLTPDTTEADLKTRRDLVNQSVVFSDQGPVRAALQGKLLILDGLEKCERNVLPTLNNLLENREMNLDDGRLIISHDRFMHLAKSSSSDTIKRSGLVPTHPNFFVVALAAPTPPYLGRQMDPPLRSRFQVRRIDFPTPSELIDAGVDSAIVQIAGAINSACEANPSMFPRLPDMNVFHIAKAKQKFPETSLRSLFTRSYPWMSDELNFAHRKTLLRIIPATDMTDKTNYESSALKSKLYLSKARQKLARNLVQDYQLNRDMLICGAPGVGKSRKFSLNDCMK